MTLTNSLILLFFISASAFFPAPENHSIDDNGILIQNSAKDVKMGINSSEIFLIISEKALNINNEVFQERYEKEYQQFIESKGRMIISEPVFLKSKTISVALEDIRSITIVNEKIEISYLNSPSIKFEDIKDVHGRSLLYDFYPSDLQKIVSYYNKSR